LFFPWDAGKREVNPTSEAKAGAEAPAGESLIYVAIDGFTISVWHNCRSPFSTAKRFK